MVSIPRHDGERPGAPSATSGEALSAIDLRTLWERYASVDNDLAAHTDPDVAPELLVARRDVLLAELLGRRPDAASLWYDLGMYAKWRRDWPVALDASRRALDLLVASQGDGAAAGEPAAWNLGIAATALRDWAVARRAWTTFGVRLPAVGDPSSEVVADYGLTPVRLNPAPRFLGESPGGSAALSRTDLGTGLPEGRPPDTEVVWGRRICPARVRIVSVPTSGTRHRFGDVVLHDGDRVGSRLLDGQEVGVFNEIALWERSVLPTLTATVDAPAQVDVEALEDLADGAGLGVEDWTANLRLLCRACSEGSSEGHDHEHEMDGATWTTLRTIAFGGRPDDVRAVLDEWARGARGRAWTDLEVVLG